MMIYELSNPVVKTLINHLRNSKTDALRFRQIIHELARLLAYEALKDEDLEKQDIITWKGKASYTFIKEEDLVFIPILRAGLPMIESLTALFPESASGFLAMKRDEKTHQSVLYYDNTPPCEGKTVILLDPMVATGGSLSDAIDYVEKKSPKKIISLNVIGAPEGLEVIEKRHPNVNLYIAQIDEKLNENMYIIPGLGDAGDRAYNTQ